MQAPNVLVMERKALLTQAGQCEDLAKKINLMEFTCDKAVHLRETIALKKDLPLIAQITLRQ